MTAAVTGVLSRTWNRLGALHLVLLALTITTTFLYFSSFPTDTDAECATRKSPRPHQAFISLKAGFVNALKGADPTGSSSNLDGNSESVPTGDVLAAEFKNGLEVYPSPPPADSSEYVAMCLLVKDDPHELREFFTHHYHHHGIRRFYIYDDGSNPPLADHPEIDSYGVPESVLSFIYIDPMSVHPGEERMYLQDRTMERCVRDHGSKHHWMGLLDPDEYLEMRHAEFPTLLGWLKHWEEMDVGEDKGGTLKKGVGALAISWLPHSSDSQIEIPTTGFRNTYKECVSGGRADYGFITHVKSFVRPPYVSMIPNIHSVIFHNDSSMTRYGEHMDDTRFEVSRQPPTHEYWALHHYATGSRKYFEQKGAKGRSQGDGMFPVDEAYWNRYHDGVTTYRCDEMAAYTP